MVSIFKGSETSGFFILNFKLKTMKTKLLKKVRKRYSINRYDFINISNHAQLDIKSDLICPFYTVEDSYDELNFNSFQTIEEAMNALFKLIRNHYPSNKPARITKVWYNK